MLGMRILENAGCEYLPEFLINYSETRHQKWTHHSLKSCFFVFEILAFLAGKWHHQFGAKFCWYGKSNVAFHKDLKKEKKGLKYVHLIKRYVLKCEILLFLVTKWREIQKRYIFWLDRHISKLFSVLRSLWKVLLNSNIGYPTLAKPKFGANLWRHFPTERCQNRKNKKHKILENEEIIHTWHFWRCTCPACVVVTSTLKLICNLVPAIVIE